MTKDTSERLHDGSYRVFKLGRHDGVEFELPKPIEYDAKCTRDNWQETADRWCITINGIGFEYYTGIGHRDKKTDRSQKRGQGRRNRLSLQPRQCKCLRPCPCGTEEMRGRELRHPRARSRGGWNTLDCHGLTIFESLAKARQCFGSMQDITEITNASAAGL